MHPLYDLAANLAGPPLVLSAAARGRFGGRWRERLGLTFFPRRVYGRPRLWLHGASVGEIHSAAAVAAALLSARPEADLYLSATTPAGLKTAAGLFAGEGRVRVLAVPLDFWGAPGRAAARLQPDALIILETELWPNLIEAAQAQGARLILASARLTDRSFRRYRLVRPALAGLLARFDLIAAAGPRERDLFAALGAPEERLTVLGNPKFDRLLSRAAGPDFRNSVSTLGARLWGSGRAGPLVVAGSTHPGEEAILAEAFSRLATDRPALRLVLAPRHVGRASAVAELLRARGLTAILSGRAAPPFFPGAQAVVVDTLGELSAFYALATVAVVGGSLTTGLTGHNPLEPAAVARPIVFGPHMAGFADEARGLLARGGARAGTPATLAEDLAGWLDEPARAEAAGRAAFDFLAARPPAAPALAEAILNFFPEKEARLCPG
ncbi:MAG: 3-deoxy-D-manno-octulosonic acid transferase [Candidatus Adiutrix sp.]|jgi:3-deoxy-D-manno-octulosonic-acid transferase|nr:3-deoxy-D-manno-octulosonic acid transferase [Candidatus Adiutrix sp.]